LPAFLAGRRLLASTNLRKQSTICFAEWREGYFMGRGIESVNMSKDYLETVAVLFWPGQQKRANNAAANLTAHVFNSRKPWACRLDRTGKPWKTRSAHFGMEKKTTAKAPITMDRQGVHKHSKGT